MFRGWEWKITPAIFAGESREVDCEGVRWEARLVNAQCLQRVETAFCVRWLIYKQYSQCIDRSILRVPIEGYNNFFRSQSNILLRSTSSRNPRWQRRWRSMSFLKVVILTDNFLSFQAQHQQIIIPSLSDKVGLMITCTLATCSLLGHIPARV